MSEASLPALAREVTILAGRVDEIADAARLAVERAAAVDKVAQQLAALRAQFADLETPADLAERLDALTEQVQALVAPDSVPEVVNWYTITNPVQAAAVLQELIPWVATVPRMHMEVGKILTECWMLHPEHVQQLLDLKALYEQAYRPRAKPNLRVEFQLRWLPELVVVLRTTHARCASGHGQRSSGTTRSAATQDGRLLDLVEQYSAWWTARSDPQRGPEPVLEGLGA